MKFESGEYIHVVGTIDLETGKGMIRYVNRSRTRPAMNGASAKRNSDVELVAQDAQEKVLERVHPVLRIATREPGQKGRPALIQEDLAHNPQMKSILLLFKKAEVHRFTAGKARKPAAGGMAFGLATPDASKPHRHMVEASGMDEGEGVTYTVQVMPEGESVWHTIAVGSPTPQVELDANQFAGAQKATLRIIRSTGIDEEIMETKQVDLSK
jgi:hypothetical protein